MTFTGQLTNFKFSNYAHHSFSSGKADSILNQITRNKTEIEKCPEELIAITRNGAAFLKDLCYRETLVGFENLAGKANTNEVPVTIHINALFEPTYFEGPTTDVNLEKKKLTMQVKLYCIKVI